MRSYMISFFFFFNDTATTEIYTLSLHDALPISTINPNTSSATMAAWMTRSGPVLGPMPMRIDRKSTRLNSSHSQISYAVFCLKKKKKQPTQRTQHVITGHLLSLLRRKSAIHDCL